MRGFGIRFIGVKLNNSYKYPIDLIFGRFVLIILFMENLGYRHYPLHRLNTRDAKDALREYREVTDPLLDHLRRPRKRTVIAGAIAQITLKALSGAIDFPGKVREFRRALYSGIERAVNPNLTERLER